MKKVTKYPLVVLLVVILPFTVSFSKRKIDDHFNRASIDRLLEPHSYRWVGKTPVYYKSGGYWIYLPREILKNQNVTLFNGEDFQRFFLHEKRILINGIPHITKVLYKTTP